MNYSEIASSDGSLVFTTSSTPEISTEPSVEPIIPSAEISEETSAVPTTEVTTVTTETETIVTVPAPEPSEYQELKVHFLDVGQGDSCFIELPNKETMLIDAGESEYGDSIVTYIYGQGYDTLDYVVATHPHADHIGGMAEIMKEFTVGTVIMPEVPSDLLPMTQNFEDMLDTIDRRGITAEYSRLGRTLDLGNGAVLEFLAPVHDDYTNLNNYSITCRLVHGNKSFLFTGDIERAAESDILNSGEYIRSDVLKVGHHGSTSSSTPAFIEAVSPEYAVIEVGEGNSYGHPKTEVVNRLLSHGCAIYTTMDNGNIVFTCDGENFRIYTDQQTGDFRQDTEEAA